MDKIKPLKTKTRSIMQYLNNYLSLNDLEIFLSVSDSLA